MNLQDEINGLLKKVRQGLPPETAAIMAGAMKKLQESGITEQACRKGDRAPAFELPSASGEMVSSSVRLNQGPLVVSFYRGSW
ncbi:MAG: hypothetical protein ABIJ52_18615 [Pseudomonadota bacterium]